jgi:hypothetical protein
MTRVSGEYNDGYADNLSLILRSGSTSTGDFTMLAAPASQTISQGQATAYAAGVQPSGGFNQPVSLSATVNPPTSTITMSFSPNPIVPGVGSTLVVSTTSLTPVSTYTITITGTTGQGITGASSSSTGSRTTTVTLNVTPGSSGGDFSLVLAPASQTVTAGASTSFSVRAQASGNFTQSVNLSARVTPSDSTVTTSFSSTTITPGNSSTLTVGTTTSTTPSTFTITITGNGGQITRSGTVTLIVNSSGGGGGGGATQEELKTDDGSIELGAISDGLIVVNRLTPSSYPVTLKSLRILLAQFQNLPSPAGESIRLIAFADPTGRGTPQSNPNLFVNQTVTVPRAGEFVEYPVNGSTISSGDIYVGYQAPSPARGVGFAADTNGTQLRRGFFSTDNGATFQGPLGINSNGSVMPINLPIRAVVSKETSGGSDFSLLIDPGAQTISSGASAAFLVNVQPISNFAQPVNLSATVTPANSNITARFSSNSIQPGSASTLTITAAAGTPASTFTITITGTSGQLVRTRTATVTVAAGDTTPPTVSVSAPSDGQILGAGTTFTIQFMGVDNSGPLSDFAIAYSTDGGATFAPQNLIGRVVGTATSIVWNIPDTLQTTQGRIGVAARDRAGNIGTALSGRFTVQRPPVMGPTLQVRVSFDPPPAGQFAPPQNVRADAMEMGSNLTASGNLSVESGEVEIIGSSDLPEDQTTAPLVGFNIYRVPQPPPDQPQPTPDQIVNDPRNLVGSTDSNTKTFTDIIATNKGNNFVYSVTSFFGNGTQSSGSQPAGTNLPVIKNPVFRSGTIFIDAAGSFIKSGALLIVNDRESYLLQPDASNAFFTINKAALSVPGNLKIKKIIKKGSTARLTVKNTDGKTSVGVNFTRN